jgi:Flp pilus assembly protein TadG
MTSAISTIRNLGLRASDRVARAVGRFIRNSKGTTAIEFSFVALPFFALMFAILETALTFFAQNFFEDSLARVARQVRTGQAQKVSGMNADAFKTLFCARLAPMFNCPGGVTLDIRTYSSFQDVNDNGLTTPTIQSGIDQGNLDTTNTQFVPGGGGDIVVVRAYYSWPVFVNRLGNNLVTMPNGTHLIVATAAFRNEPFPW